MCQTCILSFLSGRAIIEHQRDTITLKPLDYDNFSFNGYRSGLSRYCLSFLNDVRWEDIANQKLTIILDGWVIYQDKFTGIGSDIWSLNWLTERFNIIDLCPRTIAF